ncbi:hypothetical protein FH972_025041 [Carpinus fangiana]|uniref:Uncharacterized protein n=1 Tax=Carpinus fangiana TaxID=176857 RepID=A0A5N6L014_9ROSI|nr:hypothetical protein FH972_025041 [Carpinus fangiana]
MAPLALGTAALPSQLDLVSRGNASIDTVGPPICTPETVLQGDGDPHQNFLHVQVTEAIDCGGGSCNVQYTTQHTIGWSASIEGAYEWIAGGFSVEESYTTGGTYECDGEEGDGNVCVIRVIAHTAYTVQNIDAGCGGVQGDPFVMKSPNSGEIGYSYKCRRGGCGSNGDSFWDDFAPVGGPGPQAPCDAAAGECA